MKKLIFVFVMITSLCSAQRNPVAGFDMNVYDHRILRDLHNEVALFGYDGGKTYNELVILIDEAAKTVIDLTKSGYELENYRLPYNLLITVIVYKAVLLEVKNGSTKRVAAQDVFDRWRDKNIWATSSMEKVVSEMCLRNDPPLRKYLRGHFVLTSNEEIDEITSDMFYYGNQGNREISRFQDDIDNNVSYLTIRNDIDTSATLVAVTSEKVVKSKTTRYKEEFLLLLLHKAVLLEIRNGETEKQAIKNVYQRWDSNYVITKLQRTRIGKHSIRQYTSETFLKHTTLLPDTELARENMFGESTPARTSLAQFLIKFEDYDLDNISLPEMKVLFKTIIDTYNITENPVLKVAIELDIYYYIGMTIELIRVKDLEADTLQKIGQKLKIYLNNNNIIIGKSKIRQAREMIRRGNPLSDEEFTIIENELGSNLDPNN